MLRVWIALLLVGCGRYAFDPLERDAGRDSAGLVDACVGLECQVVDCLARLEPPTRIIGTVFAPNGTLPLHGVTVYVPRDDPGPLAEGAQCGPCGVLPGAPIAQTVTDAMGNFSLDNVPAGANIPLVITTGKWRRQLTLTTVDECTQNPITAAQGKLPANRAEGDIPRMAVTTGNADAYECLLREIGIADTEISKQGTDARVHLYTGNGLNAFSAGFAGGTGAFTNATGLWSSAATLLPYDIVILSCEGSQFPATKPQAALDAMKAYADLGGRIFASHWHNYWIGGSFVAAGPETQPGWSPVATWNPNPGTLPTNVYIDEVMNPTGMAFASWMLAFGGSVVRGKIDNDATTAKDTVLTVNPMHAKQWTYAMSPAIPQGFQFATPVEAAPAARCGKVMFSDLHGVDVATVIPSGYPDGCSATQTLRPQELALVYMLFHLSSCD